MIVGLRDGGSIRHTDIDRISSTDSGREEVMSAFKRSAIVTIQSSSEEILVDSILKETSFLSQYILEPAKFPSCASFNALHIAQGFP